MVVTMNKTDFITQSVNEFLNRFSSEKYFLDRSESLILGASPHFLILNERSFTF